ncbi:MAG: DUF3540 domain-containing protein [Candidatus Electrothrix sp. GW3-4]|uniref:DUF3540 domain-containing protein n=1 Tax=Candidatus Electrothrix sp. GW3-4 TaxID=3126740 RepID=UPI0030CFFC3F
MTKIASLYPVDYTKRFSAQEAEIVSFDREKRTAKIHIDTLPEIQAIDAALALPYDIDLSCGDKVLIAGEDIRSIYIIGVLSAKAFATIRADNGAYARLDNDRTSLQIFSPHNKLIIEYDTGKDTTTVSSLTGNMEFNSPESITFQSNSIDFTGKDKIKMKVQDDSKGSLSTLSLGNYQTKLNCPDLHVTAKNGNLFVDQLKITGQRVLTNLVQATLNISKIETKAKTLIHKAQDMYQSVECLSQLKTGRLKMLIKSTCHIKSKDTVLKAEEDFKVKAEEINLG